jgi:hypothetical protein
VFFSLPENEKPADEPSILFLFYLKNDQQKAGFFKPDQTSK